MSDCPLPAPLCGIIPPLVTPLKDEDTLDAAGLERLVEHILAGGVQGLFALGTTGEAPNLSHRLRREMVEQTCRLAAGRVPVLVGVTDTSYTECVELACHAADCGAAGVVLAPPFYFPLTTAEFADYLEHAAVDIPLPVFVYHMPTHTKLLFDEELVRRMVDIPNIVGMKDSSAQMLFFHRARRITSEREDFSLLVGPEELLAESVLLGGHGGVCGGANMFPWLYVELYQAARDGDRQRAAELHARVIRNAATIYSGRKSGSSFIKGIKFTLSCLGVCGDAMAEPFRPLDAAERDLLRSELDRLDLVGQPVV